MKRTYNPYNSVNPVNLVNPNCEGPPKGNTPQNVDYGAWALPQSTEGPRSVDCNENQEEPTVPPPPMTVDSRGLDRPQAAQKCPLQPEGTWIHSMYTWYWLPLLQHQSNKIGAVQLGQLPYSAVEEPFPSPTLIELMCVMQRRMQAYFPAFTFFSTKRQASGDIVAYNTHPPGTIRVFLPANLIHALMEQCGNRFFVKCSVRANENHEIVEFDGSPDFLRRHVVRDGPQWCVTIEFLKNKKKVSGSPPPVGGAAELY